MARELLSNGVVDRVLLVPCGRRKDKPFTATHDQRLKMLQLAYDEYFTEYEKTLISIDEIELKNDFMIPTYTLMTYYQMQDPFRIYHFVIGTDLVEHLDKFQYSYKLKTEISFIILSRHNYPLSGDSITKLPTKYQVYFDWQCCHTPFSSTNIRNRLKAVEEIHKKDKLCSSLIPQVASFILSNKLYTG